MTAPAALSVEALSVAFENDADYADLARTAAEGDLAGLFGGWSAGAEDADGGMIAAYLHAVSTHSGIPQPRLRMLTVRPDGAEPAARALAGLGAPPGPQPLLLVQADGDRDILSAALPRLVEETEWTVTEDLGLTHMGDVGGTAVMDLLSWWMDPEAGATVVVVDQPLFVRDDRVPDRLTAVALRFRGGEHGRWQVLGWGEGEPPADADRVCSGPGACGAWSELHRLDLDGDLRPGDRILLLAGSAERRAWLLLRQSAPTTRDLT